MALYWSRVYWEWWRFAGDGGWWRLGRRVEWVIGVHRHIFVHTNTLQKVMIF